MLNVASQAVEETLAAGADKAQAWASQTEMLEVNIDTGELALIRNGHNESLQIKAIQEQRMASLSGNSISAEEIHRLANDVVKMSASSNPDPAHDVAQLDTGLAVELGPLSPDRSQMIVRLQEMADTVREKYPKTVLRDVHLRHHLVHSVMVNSAGVQHQVTDGVYSLQAMHMCKDDHGTSSFNGSSSSFNDMSLPLLGRGGVEELIDQQTRQTILKPVPQKFIGDLIITPHCLQSFIGNVIQSVSDYSIYSGTSRWLGQLNEKVASDQLNIKLHPMSDQIASRTPISSDGYPTKNCDFIREGVLRNYCISQYAANKVDLPRSPNLAESGWIVDSGAKSLDEIIAGTEKGVLLARLSGGSPNSGGEFSGVAKNSFYIENGQISQALGETMVSGNIYDLLFNVREISREQLNLGGSILPWISFGGATVS